jgi:DNA-binding PadR family transcriptional regulator
MILGLVRWMQPVHGYDVRRELESWNAAEWANIAPGSIYHALRKLAEDGMLEEVATEQVGTRPARTTYRVTPRGELEFEELLRRYWWDLSPISDPFLAGFAFLPALPPREAAAALRNRARLLQATAESLRFALTTDLMQKTKPTHVSWMFELSIARAEVEIAWCGRIADRIEAGAALYPEDFQSAFPRPDAANPDAQ